MIDTHAHLYAEEFDDDREAMMQRASEAGVSKIVLPNVDSTTLQRMLDLEARHPGYCFSAIGVHPTSIGETMEEELALVERELKRRNTPNGRNTTPDGLQLASESRQSAPADQLSTSTVRHPAPDDQHSTSASRHPASTDQLSTPYIAIGEIGTDLYWDKTYLKQQQEAFARQLHWSLEYRLPVIIHVRESFEATFEVLQDFRGKGLRGIFHSFTGTAAQAHTISEFGTFYLGVNGIITFKNSGLRDELRHVSPEKIVLETDSPYLSPAPFRGRRNESSRLNLVAIQLAELYGMSLEKMEQLTTKNAESLFNFKGTT